METIGQPRYGSAVRYHRAALASILIATACGDGGGFPDAAPPDSPPPGGTFTLSWTVNGSSGSNLPAACDDAGATDILIGYRRTGSAAGDNIVFRCSEGTSTSPTLPPGDYIIDIGLPLAGVEDPIVILPLQVTLTSGNDTALDPVDFVFAAIGSLVLEIQAVFDALPRANCIPIAQAGAGIDSVLISLVKDSACVSTTFDIAAGATWPAGTYPSDCSTSYLSCIDSDQLLTAADMPSGEYSVSISGFTGGFPCWSGTRTVRVPAVNQTGQFEAGLSYVEGANCPAL
jgi:hypothetical protein